jgi:DNA-binding transcriptional MerR regulator
MTAENLSPIGFVARLTGLTTHVLRAWENRYGVVKPTRSSSGRRLYSQSDIDRLSLIKLATDAGHSISRLAKLGQADLQLLADKLRFSPKTTERYPSRVEPRALSPVDHLENCMQALYRLDGVGLQRALENSRIDLPRIELLTEVVSPLLSRVGDLWASGSIKIIHEHKVSFVVQGFLWEMLRTAPRNDFMPGLVVTTPLGQWCHLGAMMAAVVAADCGWRAHYFGPSLPAEEIVAAVRTKAAAALALSITFRAEESIMRDEFSKFKRSLDDDIMFYVGGRSATFYRDLITDCGGLIVDNMKAFVPILTAAQRSQTLPG